MRALPAGRRIGLLTPRYPPDTGGVAEAAARLARGLAGRGADVTVIAPSAARPPGDLGEARDVSGPLVLRFGLERRPSHTRRRWCELACARAPWDVLHGYYLTEAGFVAAYAGRYLSIPTVASARGNDLEEDLFVAERFPTLDWTVAHATRLTAVSGDLRRRILALRQRDGVEVVANGVDAAVFSPRPRDRGLAARCGLAPGEIAIGFVGEARLKKGLPTLLEAFATVHAARPEARLLLVGEVRASDRPVLELFQGRCPAAGAAVREVPYQPREALAAYYALLDQVWLPSYRDGMPNALLEAMACERPVLASAVGGIPEVVRDGETGYLLPPGDAAALAARSLALLAAPEAALGRRAREHVARHHRPEDELAANCRLYDALWSPAAANPSPR